MALVLHWRALPSALLSGSVCPDGQSEHKSLCVFLPFNTFPFPLIYITILLTVSIKAKRRHVDSFKLISVKRELRHKLVVLNGAEYSICGRTCILSIHCVEMMANYLYSACFNSSLTMCH